MLYELLFLTVINFISASERPTDVNLLIAVGTPLPRDVAPVTGPFGHRGRPAIEFSPNSYIGRYARDMLPRPFPKNFAIKVTTYLYTMKGGVLFSVVSKDQHRDFLVLEVKQKGTKNQTILLTYKNSYPSKTYVARFDVPKFSRRWTVFSIVVRDQEVWLYMNGCNVVRGLALMMRREPLQIEEDSVVYVGRAGWYSRKRPFFVSTHSSFTVSSPSIRREFFF